MQGIGGVLHVLILPVFNILILVYQVLHAVWPGGAFPTATVTLAIFVWVVLLPITYRHLKSARKMGLIQPELKVLQQRYRSDPQTLMAEERRLYRENGIRAYEGYLALVIEGLVQVLFLIGLFFSFSELLHDNLATMNGNLYPFVPKLEQIPYLQFLWTNLATPDSYHILPILAALLTFIRLRMAMPVRKPRQPGENPDPTTQATGTMQYIMPVVTLFIGWTFPAGLALYWCISTGFSAVQQYFINGNWGSLFVGVPGMEHLVPPPRDFTPTVTRAPATTSNAPSPRATPAASAAVAATEPQEGGVRGWWNRMKESAAAAQTQALERAEVARKELEASRAQSHQQAAGGEGTEGKGPATPARRQRPSRQGPVLVKPPQLATEPPSSGEVGKVATTETAPIAPTSNVHQEVPKRGAEPLSASVTVFISYSRDDSTYEKQLVRDLKAAGIKIWVDHERLRPGTSDWEKEIRRGITLSNGVIYVGSAYAERSPYVRDELNIARDNRIAIYPIWARGTVWSDCVPMGFGSIQYADGRGENYSKAVQDIIASLTGRRI